MSLKKFEVTVWVNQNSRCFVDGHQPEHELARNRGKFEFLVDAPDARFFEATPIAVWHEVADKMFAVGNRMGEDMKGSHWRSTVRSISTGDVVWIERLDTGEKMVLACGRVGWTPISPLDMNAPHGSYV